MTIIDARGTTYLYDGEKTYVLPIEPRQCGLCGAMSGIFINWRAETTCGRCEREDRSITSVCPTKEEA